MDNKKKLELAAFALIGLAILGVWAWQTWKPETSKPEEATLRSPEVKEVKIQEETSQYKISVSYPEFRNLGDPGRESAANSLVKEKVLQSINAFKDAVNETEDLIPEAKSEIEIKYETVYLNPSVASIKVQEYTYIEGAAHPLGIFWPINYNFKDNREITLSNLFTPGSNYLLALSNLSQKSLRSKLKENYIQESVEFGTAPHPENFSIFLIDRDKLTIIFNVYQVAGYAAGHQTVEIPYNELAGFQEGLIELIRQ